MTPDGNINAEVASKHLHFESVSSMNENTTAACLCFVFCVFCMGSELLIDNMSSIRFRKVGHCANVVQVSEHTPRTFANNFVCMVSDVPCCPPCPSAIKMVMRGSRGFDQRVPPALEHQSWPRGRCQCPVRHRRAQVSGEFKICHRALLG